MKIFSILFTALFFLGFTGVTYAEPEYYTVTNKLADGDDDLFIFMTKNIPFDEIDEELSIFQTL